MFETFTERARETMRLAKKEALSHNHSVIGPAHLFLGILSQPRCSAVIILKSLGYDSWALYNTINGSLRSGNATDRTHNPKISALVKKVLQFAESESIVLIAGSSSPFIATEDLLLGLVKEIGDSHTKLIHTDLTMADLFGNHFTFNRVRKATLNFLGLDDE